MARSSLRLMAGGGPGGGSPLPAILPQPGTPEFSLIVLVVLELVALVLIRRAFRHAHGG